MYKMVLKYNSSGDELSSELKKFRANTARYILLIKIRRIF